MKKEKRNLILSWALVLLAFSLMPKYDTISLFLLLLFPYFREIQAEKALGSEFLQNNAKSIKSAKTITLVLALSVLMFTLFKISSNPQSSEHLPGIWTIMFILSPMYIMLLKYELHLFKHYTKSA